MADFPHHIFREYDIRGIAGRDITDDFAYRLGKAFASMLPPEESRPLIIGRDVRLSGHKLQQALMSGVQDAGIHIIDIGITPTPLAYFSVYRLDSAGSVQVTASHNPGEYNGFKMMIGRNSLYGDEIQLLMRRMQQEIPDAAFRGGVKVHDISEEYIDYVAEDCHLARPLKVVIDAGNGPSGILAAPLYRRLGCEVTELYCEPDGSFPNHHPDPTIAENMADLASMVVEQKADIGIAFDGDGDRIGVVDEQGSIIWGDMLLLLLSRAVLEQYPGATIISEVKSSQRLYEGIRQAGGNPVMWRTGHSPIKAKMKETGALLAGEMSGHMFFADRFFGFDDAAYAGARLMQVLARGQTPLSMLLSNVEPTCSTSEIRVFCPDDKKFERVNMAKEYFSRLGYEIIDIDGIRVIFSDGWGLLRASNTQPGLVLRFEAANQPALDEIRRLFEDWLEQHNQPE